jgi:hypothetical protein
MEYSASIKIGEEYKTVGTLKDGKYGPQISIRRDLLIELLKDKDKEWLNFNIKDWSNNSSAPAESKENPPTEVETVINDLDDEVSFEKFTGPY